MTTNTGQQFDIGQLDAAFHLQALGRRIFMPVPLGVPDWDAGEKKILFNWLIGRGKATPQRDAETLQQKICTIFDVRYCLATGSGREAIKLVLIGMQLPPGARVIMPSYCCLSVLLPVLELGLQPVLADVGDDLQIDPQSVRRIVEPGDRVIIIPHLFGGLADMAQLQQIASEHGLLLLDDAAQAIGLRCGDRFAGSHGDAGIFSFGLFKPLNALGGGALLTNNKELYQQAKNAMKNAPTAACDKSSVLKTGVKVFGRKVSYRLFLQHRRRQQQQQNDEYTMPAAPNYTVSSINPLSARLATTQLDKMSERRQQVQQIAEKYAEQLSNTISLQSPGAIFLSGYPRFVVQLADDLPSAAYPKLFSTLLQHGIEVQPTYPPLHRILRKMGLHPSGEFDNSETLAERTLCLPLSRQQNPSAAVRAISQALSRFSSTTYQLGQPAWL